MHLAASSGGWLLGCACLSLKGGREGKREGGREGGEQCCMCDMRRHQVEKSGLNTLRDYACALKKCATKSELIGSNRKYLLTRKHFHELPEFQEWSYDL